MTGFQTQAYASSVSIDFDSQKGVYVGSLASRGGMYQFEGPDRASVMYEAEAILREEYDTMMREVARGKAQAVSRGRGGGSSENHRQERNKPKEKIDGVPILTRSTTGRDKPGIKTNLPKWAEAAITLVSIAHGNWMDLAINAAVTVARDWYENVESLWDRRPTPKIFTAVFGGIVITATSRKMLRLMLIRQRNLRIQRIMAAIRLHDEERDNASSTDNLTRVSARIKSKKVLAMKAFQPKSWEGRVSSPQGQETGWKGRALDMRSSLQGKKAKAMEMWANRV